MQIAYLINQYPAVSHTFIRREILALEKLKFDIKRVSIRPTLSVCIDQEDEQERKETKSLLQSGVFSLFVGIIKCLVQHPLRFFKATYHTFIVGWKSERGLFIHMIYLAEACLLFNWTKSWNIKHIHAHFGTNSTTVAMFCKFLGGPSYSFTCHGPEEYDKPNAIALEKKIKHASFVVAISYFGQSQLYRWSSASDWKKIKIVHCCVDASDLNKEPVPVPQINRLVCVGRLCEQKGQQLLVQATAEVIRKGIIFELVLVGDGEMRNDIERMISSLGIQQHVRITGWASGEEVRKELSNSKGLLLPSFAEGLPVVIMESFALGRPVISSCIAGIPELVHPGENGWLCSPSDIESLASTIEELLTTSTKQLTEMGLNGRKLVEKNHNDQKEAVILAKAIRNCLSTEIENNN